MLFWIFSFCLAMLFNGCKSQATAHEGVQTRAERMQASNNEEATETPATGNEKNNRVQATGRVRLVGSGAMPELVIRGEDKQWYIAGEEMQKLNHLQHEVVTVEGEESIRELKWANGQPAGHRRYLSNIRIVETK